LTRGHNHPTPWRGGRPSGRICSFCPEKRQRIASSLRPNVFPQCLSDTLFRPTHDPNSQAQHTCP
jgi:hypothetical protein